MPTKNPTWRKMVRLYEQDMVASAALLARGYVVEHPEDAYVWIYYGASLAQMSRFTEAIPALRRAMRLLPPAKLHFVYYHLGQLRERQGALCPAERWYRRAIENCSSDAGYPITLGRLLYRAGRLREAEALFRRASRCKEGCREEAFSFLGLTLCSLEHYKEARRCFQSALEIDPKYKVARRQLSDTENVLAQRRSA
jgi:tetratricopeptide (TPR) repeat protein